MIDEQGEGNADTGINDTGNYIRNVGALGYGVNGYEEDNRTGLNAALNVQYLTEINQQEDADGQIGPLGEIDRGVMIQPVEGESHHTAGKGADEAITAGHDTALHGAAQSENCAYAGKAGVSVNNAVDHCDESNRHQGLKGTASDFGRDRIKTHFCRPPKKL